MSDGVRDMAPRYADVFEDAFRLFVGNGRRFSCEALAAATGLPLRNIKAYLAGETLPSREAEWVLKRALPPEFTDMLLAPAGLGRVQRLDGDDIAASRMQRDMAREVADLAEALDGGTINHRQAATLEPAFRRLAVECEGFADALLRKFKLRGERR